MSSGLEFPHDALVVGYWCGSVTAAVHVPPLADSGMSDRFGLGAGRGVRDLISLPLGNTAGTIGVCVDRLPCTCQPHAGNGSSNIAFLQRRAPLFQLVCGRRSSLILDTLRLTQFGIMLVRQLYNHVRCASLMNRCRCRRRLSCSTHWHVHLSTPIARRSPEFDDPLDRSQPGAPIQVLFVQPHLPGSPLILPLDHVSPSLLLQCRQRKSSNQSSLQFEPSQTTSIVVVHTKPSSATNRCRDEGSRHEFMSNSHDPGQRKITHRPPKGQKTTLAFQTQNWGKNMTATMSRCM